MIALHFLRAIKPVVMDFLSTIVFVIVYAIAGNVTLGIAAGIATGIAQFGWLLVRKQPITLMQGASLALVVVLGAAALLTADPRFVMIKPSIGAFAIAIVMLKRGWQTRYLPPIVVENVSPGVLVLWGYAWSALIFALGAANLFVAFALGLRAWTWFTGIVPITSQILMFTAQFVVLRVLVHRNIRAKTARAALTQPA